MLFYSVELQDSAAKKRQFFKIPEKKVAKKVKQVRVVTIVFNVTPPLTASPLSSCRVWGNVCEVFFLLFFKIADMKSGQMSSAFLSSEFTL
jgi:hypothetical protein